MTLRVLQLSDFHLGARPGDDPRRMDAVRRHVERLRADLIVFTGDLVDDGPNDRASLQRGRELLASFGTPFHALPGNHDVGNKPSIGKHGVTQRAVAQWCDVFGADRFVRDAGGWRIVGIDSQITGTGWPQEAAQLDWLREAVACNEPVAVFSHMPLYLYERNEQPSGRDAYWQVDPAPRRALLPLLERRNVKAIASGHVHWHAVFGGPPARMWCPACYSVVREPHYPAGGDATGMVLHTLGDDWQYELITDPELSRPDGEQPHTV